MSTEVLKEFLVSIGFGVNESQYNRQKKAVDDIGKSLDEAEKKARHHEAEEKKRATAAAQRAEETALAMRAIGAAVGVFATAATTAMLALGETIKKTVGEFDRLSYISGRTGASVGGIKALGYAFEQTGSSAGEAVQALEAFAAARRTNPGLDGLLRQGYGVNTNQPGEKVFADALDAITKRFPQYNSQRIAAVFGISAEQVDHWIRYRREVAQFDKQYRDLLSAFGVDGGEMARSSTAISRALGEFSALLEVIKIKIVSLFLPAIELASQQLHDFIGFLSDRDTIQGIADYFTPIINAFKTLGGYIKDAYDLCKQLFDYIRGSPLGKLFGALDPNFIRQKVITALQPGSAQASTNDSGDTTAGRRGVLGRAKDWVKDKLGIGDGDLTARPGSRADIRGRTFEAKAPEVMKRLMEDFDLTKEEAAVVLGNLGHESAGFTAFEEGGHGPGRGWAQWTERGRKRRFFEFAQRNGLDPKSDEANYGFLRWELEHTHASSIRKLKAARGVEAKMYAFEGDFEGAGVKAYESRFDYMRRALGAYDRAPAVASAPQPPRVNMSPGGFNVNDYLRSHPAGATNTNNSRSATLHNAVNVNISGVSDPQAVAQATTRGIDYAGNLLIRNMQTAIR